MITVQEIFNVKNLDDFITLIKLKKYKVSVNEEYSIVKWSRKSIITTPSAKGLIYETNTGAIMAPPITTLYANKPLDKEPIAFSRVIGGTLLRIWWTGKDWHVSTNYAITPKKINNSESDFESLYNDVKHVFMNSIKYSKNLTKIYELCFFVIMEHVKNPYISMPYENNLTLVRVVNKFGNIIDNYDLLFKMREDPSPVAPLANVTCESIFELINLNLNLTEPLNHAEIGINYHYADGTIYRRFTDRSVEAYLLKPNCSILYQWVYIAYNTDPHEWNVDSLKNKFYLYKMYFPWHAYIIDSLNAYFLTEVSSTNYIKTCKSLKALKNIAQMFKV